jgi:imidazolonepropionase-like amidohydrolase
MTSGPGRCGAALLCSLLAAATAPAATLIHAGRVIDGISDSAKTQQTVVVVDGKITAIESGYRMPAADDRLIDLKQGTLLPGLFDMHVHLSGEYSRNSEINDYKLNEADVAIDSVVYAERTLLAGFTTVRDLGDEFRETIALRNAINAGKVPGPRVIAAGKALATTGGHADPTNGWSRKFPADPGPDDGVVNSVEDARKAVRQRYKEGSDTIKITATGGVLSIAKSGSNPQFTEEEVRAVVSAARDYGFKVAAHAHGTEGIKRAVRGGVDTIEHGTFLDEEGIKLMKERGTFYVPTMSAGRWVYEQGQKPDFFPPVVRPKALAVGPTRPV